MGRDVQNSSCLIFVWSLVAADIVLSHTDAATKYECVQFRGLGKAHAMGEIAGFVKLIAEEESDRILGAHIIGPHASDPCG